MSLFDLFLTYAADPEKAIADGKESVSWSGDQIEEKLVSQSAAFLHWKQLAEIGKYELAKQEGLIEKLEADLANGFRVKWTAQNEKVTDKKVESAVKVSQAYQDAIRRLDQIRFITAVLDNNATALFERRDCLKSLNARHGREQSLYR